MVFMYKNGYSRWEAYGLPGKPFLTGTVLGADTELKVEFPTITKSVTIMASGSTGIRVHFDSMSNANVYSQHRYVTLGDAATDPEGGRYEFDVRCKEIYVSNPTGNDAGFELCAVCAAVDKGDVAPLTGSGINTN